MKYIRLLLCDYHPDMCSCSVFSESKSGEIEEREQNGFQIDQESSENLPQVQAGHMMGIELSETEAVAMNYVTM